MSGNAAMKIPFKQEAKMRLSLFGGHLYSACLEVKQAFSILFFGSYEARVKALYDNFSTRYKDGTLDVGLLTAKDIMPATIDASKIVVSTITPIITVTPPAAMTNILIPDYGISGPVGDTVQMKASDFKDFGFKFGGHGYVETPAPVKVKKIKVKTKKKAEKKAKKADKKKAKKKS